MAPRVAIRADSSGTVGMGHAVRCSAIAAELRALGAEVVFVAGSYDSAATISRLGERAEVLQCADARRLGADDGASLLLWCEGSAIDLVVVDTYGAAEGFFAALAPGAFAKAYIDDLYTYGRGPADLPVALPVDCVVNYSFYAVAEDYEAAYAGHASRLLIGTSYAPLRRAFRNADRSVDASGSVQRVLVTTGSTNPQGILERLARLAADVFPEAQIDVAVGPLSTFELEHSGVLAHEGADMAGLMSSCDVAVSAAGSTLYELCALGVPTLAVSLVDNQERNLRGFANLGLGLGRSASESDDAIRKSLEMLSLPSTREGFQSACQACVDGMGAERVARALLRLAGGSALPEAGMTQAGRLSRG